MDEAFDPFLEFDESTVRHQVDHLAPDPGVDRVAVFDTFPRIVRGLLEAKGDPFAIAVHFDDHDIDFLTHLEHFARVADPTPTHVSDVQEAVEAVQINKGTVIGDVLDCTALDVTRLDVFKQGAALFEPLLLNQFAAGNDNVLPLGIDLEDLKVIGLAHILVEVLGRLDVNLGGREKSVDAYIDDEPTLDLGPDAAAENRTFFTL